MLHYPTLDPLFLSRTSQAFAGLPSFASLHEAERIVGNKLGLQDPAPAPSTLIRIYDYLVTLNRRNLLGRFGSTG
jgi:hypothetical protein